MNGSGDVGEVPGEGNAVEVGAMTHNGAFEAGKRCAFSAARGRPEQVSKGHGHLWQRNERGHVPSSQHKCPYITDVPSVIP